MKERTIGGGVRSAHVAGGSTVMVNAMDQKIIAIVSSPGPWRDAVENCSSLPGVTVHSFDLCGPEVLAAEGRVAAIVLAVPGADSGSIELISRWGRRCTHRTPSLVVLAASDFNRVFVKAVNAGARDCLPKSNDPARLEELRATLADCVGDRERS